MNNPFTPTFGIVPPFLAGREKLLSDMGRAFDNWPGDPNLSSIIIGPRGSGKTALLSCIGDEARKAGWVVVHSSAMPGMLEDILQQSCLTASAVVHQKSDKHLSGINVANIIGLEWTIDASSDLNWRARMEEITGSLTAAGSGLLITVDEVRADLDEMIQLASIYQLIIRSGVKVALLMAGLPSNIKDLMENKSVTFLRRSKQHNLDRISDSDIAIAFRRTIESGGRKIEKNALEKAVSASGGFPYMMQLVGFYIWEEDSSQTINEKTAIAGINEAAKEFKNGVLKSTYRELSKGDRLFLKAMLKDKEYSRLSDICARMKKSSGYVSSYKSRMLRAGIIEDNIGELSFAIPFFREYFEELESR